MGAGYVVPTKPSPINPALQIQSELTPLLRPSIPGAFGKTDSSAPSVLNSSSSVFAPDLPETQPQAKPYAEDYTNTALKNLQARIDYDTAHGVSQQAINNYTEQALGALRNVQNVFASKHPEVAPSVAGQMTGMTDGNGKPLPTSYANFTDTPTINNDGSVTQSTPYGDITIRQNGQPNKPLIAGGTINGIPSEQANQQLAQSLLRQGVIDPNSPAAVINSQINQAIKAGQPFDDLLTKRDQMSGDPNFNRSSVTGAALPTETQYTNASKPAQSGGATPYVLPSAEELMKGRFTDTGRKDENSQEVYTPNEPQDNFRADVFTNRALEQALGHGISNLYPQENAQLGIQLANAAQNRAKVTGEKPEDILARSLNMDSQSPNIENQTKYQLAMQALKNPDPAAMLAAGSSVITPFSGGGDKYQESQIKNATKSVNELDATDKISQASQKTAQQLSAAKDRMELQREKFEASAAGKEANSLDKEAEQINSRIAALEGKGIQTDFDKQHLATLQSQHDAKIAQALKLRTDGISPDDDSVTPQPSVVAPPKAGDIVRGFQFKGGNPKDKANWTPVT